jgi:hypothetical protein
MINMIDNGRDGSNAARKMKHNHRRHHHHSESHREAIDFPTCPHRDRREDMTSAEHSALCPATMVLIHLHASS